MHTLVQELSDEHDLPLELKFESGRGYYLRLPPAELEDRLLPVVFVNVVKRRKVIELTTLELVKRNAKVSTSVFPRVPHVSLYPPCADVRYFLTPH